MDSVQNQFDYFKEVRNTLLEREQEAGKQLDFENRMKPTASEQYFDSLSDLKIGSG